MARTEFHIHTDASHDSLMGGRALLLKCLEKHVDCVAITDHNEVKGAIALKPLFEENGVAVIVGEEVFTSEGEIIGLWLTERIEPGLTPERTVAEIRRQGGAVYVPHPYDEKRCKTVLSREALIRIAGDVDCVEVHNGRNAEERFDDEQEAAYSQVAALNPDVRRVIGCDAHCDFEVGRNVVVTEAAVTREAFPACLDGAAFEASPCHPKAHGATRKARLVKMVKGGDFHGIARVLARKLSR